MFVLNVGLLIIDTFEQSDRSAFCPGGLLSLTSPRSKYPSNYTIRTLRNI